MATSAVFQVRMAVKCSARFLSVFSLVFGLLAVGALSLAVTTDYWLNTTEALRELSIPQAVEQPSLSLSTATELPGEQITLVVHQHKQNRTLIQTTIVKLHSGLWRTCIFSSLIKHRWSTDLEVHAAYDMPMAQCFTIGYFGQTFERFDGADTTMSINRSIRRASPIIIAGLLLEFIAIALATIGNTKGDAKTIGGAVIYIFSALVMAVGKIVYISAVNDEVSHRKKPNGGREEDVFAYNYGWAFYLGGASFIFVMAASVANITLYLQRNDGETDVMTVLTGLKKRATMEFYDEEERYREIPQVDRPQSSCEELRNEGHHTLIL